MKNKLIICFFSILLSATCYGQDVISKLPTGKWLVIAEQTSYVRNAKVSKEFPIEKVSLEDAYIYNFINNETLSVTNYSNEFDWKFKIKLNKDQIELFNINGDAEDDMLLFSYQKDNLVLKRIMEDTDPDDESTVIDVVTTMILRKL